jgi:hypothetical protein
MPKLLYPPPPPDEEAEREERDAFLATVAFLSTETAQALNDVRVLVQRLPQLPAADERVWVAAAIAERALLAFVYWYERSIPSHDDCDGATHPHLPA